MFWALIQIGELGLKQKNKGSQNSLKRLMGSFCCDLGHFFVEILNTPLVQFWSKMFDNFIFFLRKHLKLYPAEPHGDSLRMEHKYKWIYRYKYKYKCIYRYKYKYKYILTSCALLFLFIASSCFSSSASRATSADDGNDLIVVSSLAWIWKTHFKHFGSTSA